MSSKVEIDKPKQPELAKHDSSILDLAFVMDCTGSMGSYIDSATESIRKIVEEIVALEKSDIKLALVEYRDHPPQDTTFVTRTHDFTGSVKEMKQWLENCSAQGGGDLPEAVADGLHDALKLSWRDNATKIVVLISDAPPHGLVSSCDSFPNGCPANIDPLDVVNKMAQKGITLYSVGCEPALLPYKDFFVAIAYTTGGQYVPLRNAKLLAKVIIGGAVEEISLEKLMEEVQEEVRSQQQLGVQDENVLAERVQTRLQSKGVKTNQLFYNNSNLEKASESAIKYSKLSNMSDLRKEYKVEPGTTNAFSITPTSYSTGMHRSIGTAYAAAAAPMNLPSRMHYAAAPASLVLESEAMDVGTESAGATNESYSVKNEEIVLSQAQRLVQKALKRN